MIRLWFDKIFFWPSAPTCPGMASGAVCLKKPHHILTLLFSEVFFSSRGSGYMGMKKPHHILTLLSSEFFFQVEGQAIWVWKINMNHNRYCYCQQTDRKCNRLGYLLNHQNSKLPAKEYKKNNLRANKTIIEL